MPSPSELKVFLYHLFRLNESKKYTDAELITLVKAVYPDSLVTTPLGNHPNRISVWRSEYNRARLPLPPPCFSFRYNADGLPCNANENPLSPEAVSSKLKVFNARMHNAETKP